MVLAFLAVSLLAVAPARAQTGVWLQVEAQPTLREGEDRARAWAARFANVAGFRMNTGWYAIALGPYAPEAAAGELARLRASGAVPADAYVNTGGTYGARFWPTGAAALAPPAPAEPLAPPAPQAAPSLTLPDETLPDETPAEARRSEAALGAAAREDLQRALAWFGHYTGAIDGAIGPGTRRAMAAWQAAAGRPETGVLTTAGRALLIGAWQREQAALGLAPFRDEASGIAVDLPLALVEFDRYEPPFVRFAPREGSGIELRLISQPGDGATLAGLYEALASLDLMPLDGPRGLSGRAFTLTGRDATRAAHAEATLAGGLIKGFLVAWPASQDAAMARALPAMQSSFAAIADHALAPDEGTPPSVSGADLLAGLDIRRPERIQSGFFADGGGAVLTAAAGLDECRAITLGDDTPMRRAGAGADGIALLLPEGVLAPQGHAALRLEAPAARVELAVAGFAYGDALSVPVLTYGTMAEPSGAATPHRLTLAPLPADIGGPLLDTSGAVVGMLLPQPAEGGRVLPPEISFAAPAAALAEVLADAGIAATPAAAGAPALAAEDLARRAAEMTVRVACWN